MVRFGDGLYDAQPQTVAAGAAVARCLQSIEGLGDAAKLLLAQMPVGIGDQRCMVNVDDAHPRQAQMAHTKTRAVDVLARPPARKVWGDIFQ